ncbi:protein KINESIN LIGHT CHAIN-RELATED 2-like [Magnolia sinica]|uniref:protein KINESIN LIGHT CHAIN-RELATED 2-like n=1 Tax=Magnolia sinica TaxID=86752 RepID=UPI002659378B|nr:protein KINESIN LIGHT CHAIN-RELATED 2-like [Magnolia sinica]
MPGFVMDGVNGEEVANGSNSIVGKANSSVNKSPRSPLSPKSPQTQAREPPKEGCIDTSIERLYDNVCEMHSSGDRSPSRLSFRSDVEESRIDSELHHLVGGEMRAVEIMEEEVEEEKNKEDVGKDVASKKENGSANRKSKMGKSRSPRTETVSSIQSKRPSRLQLNGEASAKSSPKSKISHVKPSTEQQSTKSTRKPTPGVVPTKKQSSTLGASKPNNGTDDLSEAGLDNPDLGPFLLKLARDLISSGENPQKALEFALRAAKSFEKCMDGKPSLELVMSLHVVAAIHCSLGQYDQAIPVLEHSLEIPILEEGEEHALAKFAGCMQLGDTYAMLGQLENSIECYTAGLEIQKQVLGETDPRVGETCRYLAEAHVQALQFDKAEKLCQMALDIHRENGEPASLEEAADRRLMGLICETKGDHEEALEHLVLASMSMVSNGQETEVASVDCSIGDTYLSLARYDEAVFAYQKALTVFKTSKGENHPAVASVFVRLADLYNKTGKLRESKSYCESALRIYGKPVQGTPPEEIASGLTDISAIYESMNEPEQALKLLQRALKIYDDAPGQQSTIAGIEAQMGAMYYMTGNYSESYASFKNAIVKLRASGEKKSAFFGIALNQMGLTCVQRYAINEAAELFEEARNILEQEYGPYHPDTLGVYSNLAGTYDAMGRLNDAIDILEYVVRIREEKLGTANPDVDDEKRRLGELLKEAGRVRTRKAKSLETLML